MPEVAQVSSALTIGAECRLTLNDAKRIATNNEIKLHLSQYSHDKLIQSYQFLKNKVDLRTPVYGVNTHFGDQVHLLDPLLKQNDEAAYHQSIRNRQENLIRSHTCSLGKPVSPEITRLAMLLRAHCLAQGYSGINPHLLNEVIAFFNSGITPIVGCYGSIGASGDLIPLATIAACMIGENTPVFYQNQKMSAKKALELAGLKPLQPHYRDGLALINGTSFMTAIASIALFDLNRLFTQMLNAIAMTLESLLVISSAYHPLVHQLKQQIGETLVNEFLLNAWKGSSLLTDLDKLRHSEEMGKPVQDCYSVRSVSQGFGTMQENCEKATRWVENEMNSVNDNPIIDLENNHIHHSANFMGYYITDACDILKNNIAQASTWIHALLANLIHPRKNHHLPTNLVEHPGINNGFRPIQLLAAALAVQNRKFAQAQQAYTLPTEGDNQDVNSLGTHAALDFQESVFNLERLTAILFLAATQALDFRGIKKASKSAQIIHQLIREHSPHLKECRPMSDEINQIITLLKENKI